MGDYIRRQAAIDAVNHALDRETLLFSFVRKVAISALKGLCAADVVPVVRCRDCKYRDNGNLSFECPWDYGRHGSSDEDDFCSYGEREE